MPYLHRVRVFSVSQAVLTMIRLGVGKRLGGNIAGTPDPSYQRDIPSIWCHGQHEQLGEEGGWRDFHSGGLCLSKSRRKLR